MRCHELVLDRERSTKLNPIPKRCSRRATHMVQIQGMDYEPLCKQHTEHLRQHPMRADDVSFRELTSEELASTVDPSTPMRGASKGSI